MKAVKMLSENSKQLYIIDGYKFAFKKFLIYNIHRR